MQTQHFVPRRFLPETIDLTDTAQLAPIFDRLKSALVAVTSVDDLVKWLHDHSEVCAALSESSSLAYIRMTCQTDDDGREKAYLHIVEVVDPWLKPRQFALLQKLVSLSEFKKLPPLYAVYCRSAEAQVKIFREENIARETAVAKLTQQYQKISGAMTVDFEGKEQTLARMSRIQEDPHRSRRESAWKVVTARRLQDAEKLEIIFEDLLKLRHEIALAAGFADFRDYSFASAERFDYTPEDCLRFHDAIEHHVVPFMRELQEERRRRLGVETLRPWDLGVDPDQRPPLEPFEESAQLLEKCQHIFAKLDPRFGDYFDILRQLELVDLDNRKGKAPGGYQSTLSEARVPFIFMNAVGAHRDVEVMLHESGHAFHALAAREQPLHAYRGAPIEFCEVASMGMELLAAPHLTEFYPEADVRRARRDHLEGIIKFFPWMAAVDAFQHWIYTHPQHTREERSAQWVALMDRFGGSEDYSGFEKCRAQMWHRQLHIFEIPFYYVEYGIAQLGALQLWQHARRSLPEAVDHYLRGLALGGSRPLPDLFAEAGLAFDFTDKTIAPLMGSVKESLLGALFLMRLAFFHAHPPVSGETTCQSGPRRNSLYGGLLALAILSAFPLRAEPSDDEKKALATAEQSYHDGAFDVVNDRVAALLKKYPKSELAPQAEILQAQALYQLGRDDAAAAAFTLPIAQVPAPLQADTLYWQAQALLDVQKWPQAEAKFRQLLALRDLGTHAGDGDLGLAWSIFNQGREAEALPIIEGLFKDRRNPGPAQQAGLLLAKVQLAKGQFPQAIASLQALAATNPEAELAFKVNYWLGEAYAGNNQPDQAAASFRLVTAAPLAFPKWLVAAANLGLGSAERTLGQFDQAATAYEKAYELAENETARLDAFRAFLESAREAKQLPEAVATLQEYAKNASQSAPAALFAIGLVLAEDGEEDKAIGTLESLLVAYSTSDWAPAANEQLGRLYARAGKPDLAIKALQTCVDTSPDPALVRAARFELGRVFYDRGDYANAAAQFAPISEGTDSAAEDASFNYLLAQAKLGKADAFAKAQADFAKRFPASGYTKQVALAQGLLLAAQGKSVDAKAVMQKALGADVATPDQKTLLRALADLQYETGDPDDALANYQKIVTLFPNDSLEAAERAILISNEQKKLTDDQAETALGALTQKYGKTAEGAEAFFQLGEFYSFRQDYVKAQDAFQQLTAAYPQSDYADRAYFFAGQAAFQHQDYATARALLEKVADTSPFKPEARLWEGKTYQQQLDFAQAATILDTVLATEKSGETFVEANLLKGECFFEEKNYSGALDAFGAVLKSSDGTIAQRNQAATRSAKCLQELGQRDEAMEMYLNVLYGRLAGDDTASPQPPDFSWQVEAGVQAGMMRESDKDFRGAIEIYKRLEQIGGAHQQEFHDLIDKIRRDNYIYE